MKNVDSLRIPIDILNREIHKNGFEVRPTFRYKCKRCKKEFQDKPLKAVNAIDDVEPEEMPDIKESELECDVCQGTEFAEPNYKNRKVVMNLIDKYQNNNNQKLMHLSKMVERDMDIADMAHLLLLKKYEKTDGAFRQSRLQEIIRVSPAQVVFIADPDGNIGYDDQGNAVYFCPEHRTDDRVLRERNAISDRPPACPKCGFECLPCADGSPCALVWLSVFPVGSFCGIRSIPTSRTGL